MLQISPSDVEKDYFWKLFSLKTYGVPVGDYITIARDLNNHVGEKRDDRR